MKLQLVDHFHRLHQLRRDNPLVEFRHHRPSIQPIVVTKNFGKIIAFF